METRVTEGKYVIQNSMERICPGKWDSFSDVYSVYVDQGWEAQGKAGHFFQVTLSKKSQGNRDFF